MDGITDSMDMSLKKLWEFVIDRKAWRAAVHWIKKSHHNAVRLDLNYRRKTIKNSNIWRLNNMLLNNQQITEEIKICIETNENENTTTPNLWDTVKAVLRGKIIAILAYLKKQEKSQINNLTLHLKSEKAMAPYSSTLALKIPWMEEPGRLQSMGSLRVGYD